MAKKNQEVILRGRLDGRQRNKLKSLLNMMYTPRELAEEIGIIKEQVYMVYVPLGCPHERDNRNHILINGIEFAKWYSDTFSKLRLKTDETFCKTCKKAVKLVNPQKRKKGNLIYALSKCSNCGRGLTKILSNTKGE